jgi:hypothetical protein
MPHGSKSGSDPDFHAQRRFAPLALRLVRRFFPGAGRRAGLRRAILGAGFARDFFGRLTLPPSFSHSCPDVAWAGVGVGSLAWYAGILPRSIDQLDAIQLA